MRKKASIGIPLLPESREDDRLSKLYRFQPIRCESSERRLSVRRITNIRFSAAEQSEQERREAIDQKQVLQGTSTAPSEINWSPATIANNKKKLSAALGIVRSVDKTPTTPAATETKTVLSKSLVSYDDDDDDSS